MKILKFNISGKTAFFKKPDVNTYRYLTYGQLHKVALMGILGCIIGLDGYREQSKDEVFPEFYDKLKDIKVAIEPISKNGKASFMKSFQTFNNSVGYASFENGGNLIIKEQWLVDVSWDVYLVVEDEITNKIADYILNRNTVYMPYLGKNDHYLDIDFINNKPRLIEVADWSNLEEIDVLDTLFIKDDVSIDTIKEKDKYSIDDEYWDECYSYKEYLPYGLNEHLIYKSHMMMKTNRHIVINNENSKVATIDNKNVYFF